MSDWAIDHPLPSFLEHYPSGIVMLNSECTKCKTQGYTIKHNEGGWGSSAYVYYCPACWCLKGEHFNDIYDVHNTTGDWTLVPPGPAAGMRVHPPNTRAWFKCRRCNLKRCASPDLKPCPTCGTLTDKVHFQWLQGVFRRMPSRVVGLLLMVVL